MKVVWEIALFDLSCVYTLPLIGPISYPGEFDESTASFSHGMYFVTFVRI